MRTDFNFYNDQLCAVYEKVYAFDRMSGIVVPITEAWWNMVVTIGVRFICWSFDDHSNEQIIETIKKAVCIISDEISSFMLPGSMKLHIR